MKITLLCGHYLAGSGYQEEVLSKSLGKLGHCVTIITSNKIHRNFSDSQLEHIGVQRFQAIGLQNDEEIKVLRLNILFSKQVMVWCKNILNEIKNSKPDCIILYNPGQLHPLAGVFYRLFNKCKVVTIFEDNKTQYANLSIISGFIKRGLFYLIKGPWYMACSLASNKVFANTINGTKLLRPLSPLRKIDLLPLSYNETVFFFDNSLREKKRKSLGLMENNVLFFQYGKIIPKKRIDVLLQLFKKMLLNDPNIRLLIIGFDDSQYSTKIKSHIENDAMLSESVITIDFCDQKQLNKYANAADVGLWHQQPAISIQQSMGTGLFSILPKNDIVGHLIEPELNGYEFSDLTELDEFVQTLISKGNEYINMRRQERSFFNQRYSRINIAKSLIEML